MNEYLTTSNSGRCFSASLSETDPELADTIGAELRRQQDGIELIASENIGAFRRTGGGGAVPESIAELGRKINSAVFPGLQGGPLMHVIAGKAVAFAEALRPDFRAYQTAVVDKVRVLAETLKERGLAIVTGGTDCHLVLVDVRPKRVTGKAAEASLKRASITANKNAVPFDPEKPAITSGIRLGSPAATTRGFGRAEFRQVALNDRRGDRGAGRFE